MLTHCKSKNLKTKGFVSNVKCSWNRYSQFYGEGDHHLAVFTFLFSKPLIELSFYLFNGHYFHASFDPLKTSTNERRGNVLLCFKIFTPWAASKAFCKEAVSPRPCYWVLHQGLQPWSEASCLKQNRAGTRPPPGTPPGAGDAGWGALPGSSLDQEQPAHCQYHWDDTIRKVRSIRQRQSHNSNLVKAKTLPSPWGTPFSGTLSLYFTF